MDLRKAILKQYLPSNEVNQGSLLTKPELVIADTVELASVNFILISLCLSLFYKDKMTIFGNGVW